MKPAKTCVILMLAVVAGFAGGVLSGHMFKTDTANAKEGNKKVMDVETLRIVDKDGTPRGSLGVSPAGSVGLLMSDKNGANMFLTASSFSFFDKRVKERISFEIKEEGFPYLAFRDENGKARAQVTQSNDGDIGFALLDKQGRLRAIFKLDKEGLPYIRLLDENGNFRAVLGHTELVIKTGTVEKRAAASLVLFNKEGKVLWSSP
jgi:hypothetical protein